MAEKIIQQVRVRLNDVARSLTVDEAGVEILGNEGCLKMEQPSQVITVFRQLFEYGG